MERFGVSKSTSHCCVMRVVVAILAFNMEQKVISWPSVDKVLEISSDFEKSYHFPGM